MMEADRIVGVLVGLTIKDIVFVLGDVLGIT